MSPAPARATARTAWRPWSQAWIERSGIAPVWAGVALAAADLLAGAALHRMAIDPTDWLSREALNASLVFALLIGYGPAALALARRGHATTLAELRPALRCSEAEFQALGREIERFDARLLRIVGCGLASIAVLVTLFTTGLIEQLGTRSPWLAWILFQNGLAFWLTSRTVAHDVRVSRELSRAAERWAEVDVLDPTRLSPLARRGLQSALLIVLGISIFSLVYRVDNLSLAVPVAQVLTVFLAAVALLLPSLGVHRRLRAARREELADVSRELRALRAEGAGAASGPAGAPGVPRLAALLTLRQQLESAREWPFDLGTLGRFALYAAIGLGSWLGGALVERLVDAVFG